MEYLLMIVEPRGQRAERTEAQGRALYERMQGYARELQARGVLKGVNSLVSDDRAARLQVREGRQRVVDGPFAESKEMVGGYFLVECASRAQALELAAQCPAAQWATVEVREVGPCFL